MQGDDADEVDALAYGLGGFFLSHFLEGAVNAIRGEEEVLAGELGFSGSEEKQPATSSIFPSRFAAILWTEPIKCSASTAYHAHFEFPVHKIII